MYETRLWVYIYICIAAGVGHGTYRSEGGGDVYSKDINNGGESLNEYGQELVRW